MAIAVPLEWLQGTTPSPRFYRARRIRRNLG